MSRLPTIEEFKAWLAEHSKGVESRFMRWLIDENGACSEEDYCPECARIQLAIERYKVNGFTIIDGWDDYFPADGDRECELCGCVLNVSLTEDCIEEYWLGPFERDEVPGLSREDCHSLHVLLDGIGAFNEEKHWPRLQKLAAEWIACTNQ
jgi:hypothetical protein